MAPFVPLYEITSVYYAGSLDKMQSGCVPFFENMGQFPELASCRMAFFNHPGPVLRRDWSKEVGYHQWDGSPGKKESDRHQNAIDLFSGLAKPLFPSPYGRTFRRAARCHLIQNVFNDLRDIMLKGLQKIRKFSMDFPAGPAFKSSYP